jgi:hypothetical protein
MKTIAATVIAAICFRVRAENASVQVNTHRRTIGHFRHDHAGEAIRASASKISRLELVGQPHFVDHGW